MSERTFTAAEVQAAIEAVILYERARAELQMRMASHDLMAVARANRSEIHRRRHQTLDEIIGSLNG